jgi:hypothetical protein
MIGRMLSPSSLRCTSLGLRESREREPLHRIGDEGRGLEQPRVRSRRGSGQLMREIADYTWWRTAESKQADLLWNYGAMLIVAGRDILLGPKTPEPCRCAKA